MTAPSVRLPAVDRVLGCAELAPLLAAHGAIRTTAAVRARLQQLRERLLAGERADSELELQAIAAAVAAALAAEDQPRLRAVFNCTGTVLHTNLGRALLPDAAVQAVVQALTAPANLEYDLATGGRGDRDDVVDELLRE
ncbi:L-seryl-tRNA(Sec) selenium transferase, partial [Afifella sp. IM 167]|nr:L-seryl-tRNA(Sec) selenium transferase [Afifella sp. IM 167]